jgi:hypothetical protein
MKASSSNPIFAKVRRTARMLAKPQAVVARNWLNAGMLRTPAEERRVGITLAEYEEARRILGRLAAQVTE